MSASQPSPRTGAYGLALTGLPSSWRPLLLEASPEWPQVGVEFSKGDIDGGDWFGEEEAEVVLAGPTLARFDRAERRAEFIAASAEPDDRLAHSQLSALGAMFARWMGREPLHGGGFVVDGKAFGLFGEKGAGKSTTLAALAMHGVPVLADDLLVLGGGVAQPGARALDLRPDAIEMIAGLEAPHATSLARGGERRRLALPPMEPAAVPFGGWFVLELGDRLTIEEIPLAERLEAITPHRAIGVRPLAGDALLDALAVPAWRMTRSPDLPPAQVAEILLDSVA
jgi:hypothetical protein